MKIEDPVRGEGFGLVISGQMEVVQATLKGNTGRGRRGRDGEMRDEDEDDGEEGEGEDGMIGLGGYGGSYINDAEDDIILNGGAPLISSLYNLLDGLQVLLPPCHRCLLSYVSSPRPSATATATDVVKRHHLRPPLSSRHERS